LRFFSVLEAFSGKNNPRPAGIVLMATVVVKYHKRGNLTNTTKRGMGGNVLIVSKNGAIKVNCNWKIIFKPAFSAGRPGKNWPLHFSERALWAGGRINSPEARPLNWAASGLSGL
jgi:hypothetical protein